MRVVVTGANGFVGGWLIRRLLAHGHEVTAAAGPQAGALALEEQVGLRWVPLELSDPGSVRAVAALATDWVVHLAGAASVAASFSDPVRAWELNALGTVRLLDALLARRREAGLDPVVLVVSSAEVYGCWSDGDPRPRRESDPPAPVSPYAASKLAAEEAGREAWRRAGLRVVVARPFPHCGPGQAPHYLVPSLVARVQAARRAGSHEIPAGNLDTVRDLLAVEDVTAAYLALLERGQPGETYNIATGRGIRLSDLLDAIATRVGWPVVPRLDPTLARPTEIPHLVGDPSKIRDHTGWRATCDLNHILQSVVHAEAD
jgi:GDP-4-dehydro-6-deoxy-D-mannose reductase